MGNPGALQPSPDSSSYQVPTAQSSSSPAGHPRPAASPMDHQLPGNPPNGSGSAAQMPLASPTGCQMSGNASSNQLPKSPSGQNQSPSAAGQQMTGLANSGTALPVRSPNPQPNLTTSNQTSPIESQTNNNKYSFQSSSGHSLKSPYGHPNNAPFVNHLSKPDLPQTQKPLSQGTIVGNQFSYKQELRNDVNNGEPRTNGPMTSPGVHRDADLLHKGSGQLQPPDGSSFQGNGFHPYPGYSQGPHQRYVQNMYGGSAYMSGQYGNQYSTASCTVSSTGVSPSKYITSNNGTQNTMNCLKDSEPPVKISVGNECIARNGQSSQYIVQNAKGGQYTVNPGSGKCSRPGCSKYYVYPNQSNDKKVLSW